MISLSTIISTNIIACKPPNINNKNNKPIKPEFIPQQPPKNSNWKLVDNLNFINYKVDNKWYIAIFKNYTKNWYIVNFLNDSKNDKILGEFCFDGICQNIYLSSLRNFFKRGDIKTIYQWNNINNSNTPQINNNTGEITNWNEKIES